MVGGMVEDQQEDGEGRLNQVNLFLNQVGPLFELGMSIFETGRSFFRTR